MKSDIFPSLVVVFTPGKTGTKSLYATLLKYFRVVASGQDIVHHTHWLKPEQAKSLRGAFSWKQRSEVGARADQVSDVVRRLAASREAVVFTCVRNPVQRMRSDFYYRCPELLSDAVRDGKVRHADELSSLLRALAANQARKEAEWWDGYEALFKTRLRDMKELPERGWAVREWKGRKLVVLRIEDMTEALPEAISALRWPTKYLSLKRANVSPISRETRAALDDQIETPINVIRRADCFEDWAIAYPELRS